MQVDTFPFENAKRGSLSPDYTAYRKEKGRKSKESSYFFNKNMILQLCTYNILFDDDYMTIE